MDDNLNLQKNNIINIQVITNSRERCIESIGGLYRVKIRSPALKGKANKELINYFKLLGYKIRIIKGEKSNKKVIEVIEKNKI
jgi:uncharacterized protein (TIGR00251 family)